jgi:hypothetical protein
VLRAPSSKSPIPTLVDSPDSNAHLHMTYRDLSALDHASTENTIRQCSEQIGLQIDAITPVISRKLNSHQQTLVANLDAQCRHVQKVQGNHQRTLISTIKLNHHQQTRKSKDQQQALTSKIDHNQRRVMGNISRSNHLATRNYRQGSSIERKVDTASQLLAAQHHWTTDMLSTISAQFQRLEFSRSSSSARLRSGCREIYFLGEDSDMIMANLLLVRQYLNNALDYLLAHHRHEIAEEDVQWLRSEFQHLTGSASQEHAALYADSDATPFDQWSYPEDTVGYLKDNTRMREDSRRRLSKNSLPLQSRGPDTWAKQKRPRGRNRTWTVKTTSGVHRISLPNRKLAHHVNQAIEEVGFSCTLTQGDATHMIDAHFLRDSAYASQPRMCAQLNVLTIAEINYDMYYTLFRTGSIEEIDTAVRNGVISPYHIDNDGNSYCLWVSFICPHYYENNSTVLTKCNHSIRRHTHAWTLSNTLKARVLDHPTSSKCYRCLFLVHLC